MHAPHRSIRLRWSHKSTRFRARLALSPGVSHKNTNKLTKNTKVETLYIIYLPTSNACLPPIHKAPMVPQIHLQRLPSKNKN